MHSYHNTNLAVCQNLVPLENIKIAGKWMFITLKMVLIGIDPYPFKKKHPDQTDRHRCGCHVVRLTVKCISV